jgi:uncharacterized membrane protein YhaH (DUF805 family)
MGYKWLLSRFDGRIGRARYWLATLIIMGAMVSGLRLLSSACDMLGIVPGTLNIDLIGISASIEPADGDVATEAGLFPRIATVLMALVFAWFYAAASIRRLHDRNKSGWWVVPFLVATGLHDQFAARFGGSWPAVLFGMALYVVFIWGIVEMYFLRGTRGSNRFGADPLAPASPDPPVAPHWDQQSELEFVPHSAGPSPGAHVKRGHD